MTVRRQKLQHELPTASRMFTAWSDHLREPHTAGQCVSNLLLFAFSARPRSNPFQPSCITTPIPARPRHRGRIRKVGGSCTPFDLGDVRKLKRTSAGGDGVSRSSASHRSTIEAYEHCGPFVSIERRSHGVLMLECAKNVSRVNLSSRDDMELHENALRRSPWMLTSDAGYVRRRCRSVSASRAELSRGMP